MFFILQRNSLLQVNAVVLLLLFAGQSTATRAYGCLNSMISDEWREMMDNLQNDLRRKLAKGKQTGKGGKLLPAAEKMVGTAIWRFKLMNKLYYARLLLHPRVLESLRLSKTFRKFECDRGVCQILNCWRIKASRTCNATDLTNKEVKNWWKEGSLKQETQAKVQDNDKFSRMAYFENNVFACTYHHCSGVGLNIVCLYNKDGAAASVANLYTVDANGFCSGCADCEDGLCPKNFDRCEKFKEYMHVQGGA
ncbi:hypothetical protein Y032_1021g3418 [Ancylostoma ceylanicum]|uniref:4Fe-4S ferredoxin-type domain-containing protein n=1 Tax=Ancylostoma ceylanicum TaxID=53326 RepID=A0A016W8I6_9BILA|nr:hypothetical protein Y032_1021g3418 [Ancylostoma ceylanicum]